MDAKDPSAQLPRCQTPLEQGASFNEQMPMDGAELLSECMSFDLLRPGERPLTRLAVASAIADTLQRSPEQLLMVPVDEALRGQQKVLIRLRGRSDCWLENVLRIVTEEDASPELRRQAIRICQLLVPWLLRHGRLPVVLQAASDGDADISAQAEQLLSVLVMHADNTWKCAGEGGTVTDSVGDALRRGRDTVKGVVAAARAFAASSRVPPLLRALAVLADLRHTSGDIDVLDTVCCLLREQHWCLRVHTAAVRVLLRRCWIVRIVKEMLSRGALGPAASFLTAQLNDGRCDPEIPGLAAKLVAGIYYGLTVPDSEHASIIDAGVLPLLQAVGQSQCCDTKNFIGIVKVATGLGQRRIGDVLERDLLRCCVHVLFEGVRNALYDPHRSAALAIANALNGASNSQLHEIGRLGGHLALLSVLQCRSDAALCKDDLCVRLLTGLQRLLAAGGSRVYLRHGRAELSDASTPLADTGICAESLVEFVSADVGFEPLQEEEAGPGLPVFVLSPVGDRAVFHVPADGTVGDLARLAATQFSAQGCRVTVLAAGPNEYASDMLTEGDAVRRLRDVASRVPRTAELVAELLQTYFAD